MADDKKRQEDKLDGDEQKQSGPGKRRQFLPPKGLKGRGQRPMLRGEDDFNWGKVLRVVLSWSAIIMAVFLVMTIFKGQEATEYEVTFTQYQEFLNANKIERAVVKKSNLNDFDFHGTLSEAEDITLPTGKKVRVEKFTLTLPYTNIDDAVIANWTAHHVNFNISKEDNVWINMLVGALPWIILLGVWLIIFRRMQGGGTKGIFSFGKSRAKMLSEGAIRVTFADVAGADEAKVELQEIIEFLKEPAKFQKLGGKIPRGVLLLGPPGTGKTLLARAVAGEAGVPFFSISGADFVEMFVGVGASRVRDLFEQGKKSAPCIIFIDEIDAVGRHRGAGLGGGHDEREQTLNQLLVEMDGFEQNIGVILIAATNRPDVLDPALLRPGRFDRQVVVDRPDVRGREGILKVHTRNIPLGEDVKLDVLAKGTPGLSGADLANLVNEAALLAARQNQKEVAMHHFEESKDKVMMGMERKSLIISDREKRVTSYHESGHVLVAKMLPEADPVHKVTIIPRGRALGVTTYLPMDEKHTYSKEYLEAMITYAFGGRAAEKLIFNELTTGAGNDIERASQLARKMVCEWGMSEKLGPLTYGAKEEEIFLGREVTKHRDFSEDTANVIDEEVKKIVQNCMKRAEKILSDNIDKLHSLANALLEREILDGDEIDKILRGESLPPVERKNGNGTSNASIPGLTVTVAGGGHGAQPSNGGHPEGRGVRSKSRPKK
ncbi:MAG TPA: ATP-dependent zinc metalloprotease FtsH [Bacteroidota bacterium]|nr:ATP-dependent zinc metalloprotease FtsH [Bacteroidota bacterium]